MRVMRLSCGYKNFETWNTLLVPRRVKRSVERSFRKPKFQVAYALAPAGRGPECPWPGTDVLIVSLQVFEPLYQARFSRFSCKLSVIFQRTPAITPTGCFSTQPFSRFFNHLAAQMLVHFGVRYFEELICFLQLALRKCLIIYCIRQF